MPTNGKREDEVQATEGEPDARSAEPAFDRERADNDGPWGLTAGRNEDGEIPPGANGEDF